MEKGFIQGGMDGFGTALLWTKKLHKILLKLKDNELLLEKNLWRYVTIETFFCRKCNKFLINGNTAINK